MKLIHVVELSEQEIELLDIIPSCIDELLGPEDKYFNQVQDWVSIKKWRNIRLHEDAFSMFYSDTVNAEDEFPKMPPMLQVYLHVLRLFDQWNSQVGTSWLELKEVPPLIAITNSLIEANKGKDFPSIKTVFFKGKTAERKMTEEEILTTQKENEEELISALILLRQIEALD